MATNDKPKPVLTLLSDFGTDKYPIRPSSINKIVRCNMLALAEAIAESGTEGGKAAQIGSLTHEGIAAFHRELVHAQKREAGIAAIQAAIPKFPLAEVSEANIYFNRYASDPRNINATVKAVEREVRIELAPHRLDPTGQPVIIEGTLDQIRLHDGVWTVMDYKTGQSTIVQMMNEYIYQLAAYFLAARKGEFPEVEKAYIIRGYSYRQQGATLPQASGVFVHMPLNEVRANLVLERLTAEVARIRSGEAQFGPGSHCGYCPMSGVDNCIPVMGLKLGFKTS